MGLEELDSIIVYPACMPKKEGAYNCGYVFAKFASHPAAAIARQQPKFGG